VDATVLIHPNFFKSPIHYCSPNLYDPTHFLVAVVNRSREPAHDYTEQADIPAAHRAGAVTTATEQTW
jgi:hypothetical protein